MITTDKFVDRHNGPRARCDSNAGKDRRKLRRRMIAQTVPAAIRLKNPLDLPSAMTGINTSASARRRGKNQVFKTYIGWVHNAIVPAVIRRILENPG